MLTAEPVWHKQGAWWLIIIQLWKACNGPWPPASARKYSRLWGQFEEVAPSLCLGLSIRKYNTTKQNKKYFLEKEAYPFHFPCHLYISILHLQKEEKSHGWGKIEKRLNGGVHRLVGTLKGFASSQRAALAADRRHRDTFPRAGLCYGRKLSVSIWRENCLSSGFLVYL